MNMTKTPPPAIKRRQFVSWDGQELGPLVLSWPVILTMVLGVASPTLGQMIRTEIPFTTIRNSFYERVGIDFGFNIRGSRGGIAGDRARGVFGLGPGGQLLPNLRFSQGSIHSAVPPFGHYDPGTDATFGYQVQNENGGYHLGFRFGKGNTRSITNTTPVIMTSNGATGSILAGSLHPYVTGILPVVGSRSAFPAHRPVSVVNPVELKLRQIHMDRAAGIQNDPDQSIGVENLTPARRFGNPSSTAESGDLSVKEIKRRRQQKLVLEAELNNQKVGQWIAKAESALAKGRAGAARSYLRTAIHYASDQQKSSLQQRLNDLLIDQ
ncbi:hypothetical protein OAG56_03260 [Mariniblastus sp.]|nr:hypothetical protein [Mariniblastus sp.]MDB4756366.1 hypothetical protein [Mariniblastus sp.]